jgi:hypothetical protein
MALDCRRCRSTDTRVTCTIRTLTGTKRYCRCQACGARFRTLERHDPLRPGPAKRTPRPGNRVVGSRHGASVLTEPDVLRLRALHAQGCTLTELAKRFGISTPHTSKIINRKAWTHIP